MSNLNEYVTEHWIRVVGPKPAIRCASERVLILREGRCRSWITMNEKFVAGFSGVIQPGRRVTKKALLAAGYKLAGTVDTGPHGGDIGCLRQRTCGTCGREYHNRSGWCPVCTAGCGLT